MIDREYNTDNSTSIEISIGAIIKNPKMLRIVPDHLKAKKMYKNAIRNVPFEIRYVHH